MSLFWALSAPPTPGLPANGWGGTWNPADIGANLSLSNGNFTASASTGNGGVVRGTVSNTESGKHVFEATITNTGAADWFIGIATSAAGINSYLGADAYGWGLDTSPAYSYKHNVGYIAYGVSSNTGDIIGVVLNAGVLTFYKNGVSMGAAYSGLSGYFFPAFSVANGSVTANFGATPFTYTY